MSMFFNGDKIAGGSNGSAPMNPKNVALLPGINSILLTWSDPDDTSDKDKTLLSKWAGTKIVYNEDHFPTNPTDGVMVADNIVRNAYKTSSLIVPNLENDKRYYFKFFTYSDTGEINYNEANNYSQCPGAEIVSFADATDDQVAAMIAAHYKGYINIGDYWHVGDTRKIHLSFMDCGFPDYPYTMGPDIPAQDMTFVIIGIEHDDLKTPINGHTKAAITLQCRELCSDAHHEFNPEGSGVQASFDAWGCKNRLTEEVVDNNSQWCDAPFRTWLNNVALGSLPTRLQGVVKTVIKKNLANHTDDTPGTDTEDKIFLLSASEVGIKNEVDTFHYYSGESVEGEKYPYFTDERGLYWRYYLKRKKWFNDGDGGEWHVYEQEKDVQGTPVFNEDGTPKWKINYKKDGSPVLDDYGNPQKVEFTELSGWALRSPSNFHGFGKDVDNEPRWVCVDDRGEPSFVQHWGGEGLAFAFCL